MEATDGDAIFFVCEQRPAADTLAGKVLRRLGEELGLIEKNAFRFCWVTDFPMYERNEETGRIESGFEGAITALGAFRAEDNAQPTLIGSVVRFTNFLRTARKTQIIMTIPQE